MDGKGVLALVAGLVVGMFLVAFVGMGLLRRVMDGDDSATTPLVLFVVGAAVVVFVLNAWLDSPGGGGGEPGGGGGGGGSGGDGGDGGGDGGGD
ncbi:hypothetical protein NGM33_02915 [Nocardiopsis dassonvillei]|uniref:hypothetical protein n=1 Tax=Nocardiopsis dassonvillei TaxID=2014 RepID=UPI0020A2AD07|nr:hypothetical protein [Nocardiopsis dassonvillei]MCP3012266.1 hypothetical protein [Nocardiopsis dassonvillei]